MKSEEYIEKHFMYSVSICVAPFHTKFFVFHCLKKCALWVSQLPTSFFQVSDYWPSIHKEKCKSTQLSWHIYVNIPYYSKYTILFLYLSSSSWQHCICSFCFPHNKLCFFCYIFPYLIDWIANNSMLCVCRGEAVRLFHVWHEVFPALPPGETQTHSYGYGSIYRTQFKLRNLILWPILSRSLFLTEERLHLKSPFPHQKFYPDLFNLIHVSFGNPDKINM